MDVVQNVIYITTYYIHFELLMILFSFTFYKSKQTSVFHDKIHEKKKTLIKHTLKYNLFSTCENLKLHNLDRRRQRSNFPNMIYLNQLKLLVRYEET